MSEDSGYEHTPTCELAPHGNEHPCGRRQDKPGELCRPCLEEGIESVVPESGHCSCWVSLDGMPLADLKALFADINLSLSTPKQDEQ